MINFPPILADINLFDLIFWGFILFTFFGKAILSAFQQKPNKAPPPQRPPRPPNIPKHPQAEKPLGDEVEEFLRRAIARRKGEQPAEVEIIEPVTHPVPPTFQMKEEAVAEAHAENPLIGENVEDHVRSHINTSDFETRQSKLGTDIDQADEKMADHVQDVFNHDLGQLSESAKKETKKEKSSKADDIFRPTSQTVAGALRDPGKIRQAIILGEILNRPEDRW